MENTYNLTDEDDTETFECLMQTNQIRQENTALENQINEMKASSKVHKKIWDAIKNITDNKYNPEQSHLENIPCDVIYNAFDIAFGKEGNLIQPSHKLKPFSLIKKRDLKEYIPTNPDESTLLSTILKDSAVRSLEVIREYTSENTKRAFNGDIIYWQAWLSAIGFSFRSNITVDILKHFILQHVENIDQEIDKILVEQGFKSKQGTHSLETVKRRIASLSVCLEMDKFENPCRDKEINLLLKRLTKIYGGKSRRKKAITKDILDDIILTCGRHSIDIRDKALLLFAFSSGGRRRCEVTSAEMENLTETSEGDYIYNLNHSKTNQTGEDDYKPVRGKAAKALRDWLQLSGVKEGPIFRSIGKGGDIRGALSGNDVRRIVKKRAKLAGYDENQFSAHSLRRGFVTEGAKQGKPIGDIMKMTSHKSISTAMKYYEAGSIINNSCADLIG